MRLKGKVAIVTGSSSGIGRATAVLMAEEGAKVAVVDVADTLGRETVQTIKEIGGEAIFIHADVTKEVDVKKMVEQVTTTYGKVDILHNNVGKWKNDLTGDTVTQNTLADWEWLIDTNLKGTFLCSKYVIPEMKKAGGGCIINTITTNAWMNYPGQAGYASAKAAVMELTKSMCMDYGPSNIRVNGLVPGETLTPAWHASLNQLPNKDEVIKNVLRKIPLGRFAQPEDIARGAVWLATDEAAYVTGAILVVDGGLTAGFFS